MARIPKTFVMAHADANALRRRAADRVVGLLLAYPERTKASGRYEALVEAEARTDEAAARGDGDAFERGAAEEWNIANELWRQTVKHLNTSNI